MAGPGKQYTADGNIAPCRFVTLTGGSADMRVLQAGANASIIGIAQPQQRYAPYGPLQDGNAAVQGETLRVFTATETTWLQLGGTVTRGDLLESDANGKGITSSTDGHFYGAKAEVSGVLDQLIPVTVTIGMRGA